MANFNSKETYLARRAEWKADYARLATEARVARAAFNRAASEFSKAPSYKWGLGPTSPENATFLAAECRLGDARATRNAIRNEANAALYNLAAMKEEACRQWMAHHLAVL